MTDAISIREMTKELIELEERYLAMGDRTEYSEKLYESYLDDAYPIVEIEGLKFDPVSILKDNSDITWNDCWVNWLNRESEDIKDQIEEIEDALCELEKEVMGYSVHPFPKKDYSKRFTRETKARYIYGDGYVLNKDTSRAGFRYFCAVIEEDAFYVSSWIKSDETKEGISLFIKEIEKAFESVL
jgi:hypothetical protein